MRGVVGALLLLGCAWATHTRAQAWRSDEALFSAAVVVAPELPRPALNLGVALVKRGAIQEGLTWTLRSALVASAAGDDAHAREALRHLQWINVVSGLPCYPDTDRPLWCAWVSP